MKLISLNAWGCRIKEPIFEYIQKESKSTDIFCFQEILKGGISNTDRGELKSGYEDIANLLPNYTGYFSEYGEGGYYAEPSKDLDFQYGIACFVRNNLKHSFVGGEVLFDPNRKWNDYSGNFAAGAALAVAVDDYVIVNVHGLWQGSIKEDTEAKIEQSKQIMNLATLAKGRKVICGDFNLLPHTKSIQMIGDEYTDLIKKYDIKSTRSSLYTKTLRYSDYAFVDKDIIINDFSVPDLNVSDHLPLEINLGNGVRYLFFI